MIALKPGSFAWLAWHELRLAWRGRGRAGIRRALGLVLLAGYLIVGILVAVMLMGVPIDYQAQIGIGILAGTVVALSFMTTQAIIGKIGRAHV